MDFANVSEWIALIEKHPTAILVLVLAAGNWWQAKRISELRGEHNKLVRTLLQHQGAVDMDSETTQIVKRHERRKSPRA